MAKIPFEKSGKDKELAKNGKEGSKKEEKIDKTESKPKGKVPPQFLKKK